MAKLAGKVVSNAALVGLFVGLVGGCSTTATRSPEPAPTAEPAASEVEPPDEVPVKAPPSRYGNPQSYVVFGRRYHVLPSSKGFRQQGMASWYGPKFHGRKTSSGTPFDMHAMTAAHKRLPIPTYVKVTHLDNGRSIIVKVNDRGPFAKERVIDLSFAAAKKLGMLSAGTAAVEVVALPPYQHLAGAEPSPREPAAVASVASQAPLPVSTDGSRQGEASAALVRTSYSPGNDASTATPSDPGAGQLYVQVGAFSERHNAEQLQSRLNGRLPHPIRIDSNPGVLHKVQVGPINDVSEADSLRPALASIGIGNLHLVYE